MYSNDITSTYINDYFSNSILLYLKICAHSYLYKSVPRIAGGDFDDSSGGDMEYGACILLWLCSFNPGFGTSSVLAGSAICLFETQGSTSHRCSGYVGVTGSIGGSSFEATR
jgi:hypothetical protein